MKMLINILIVATTCTVGLPANAAPKPTTLEGCSLASWIRKKRFLCVPLKRCHPKRGLKQ